MSIKPSVGSSADEFDLAGFLSETFGQDYEPEDDVFEGSPPPASPTQTQTEVGEPEVSIQNSLGQGGLQPNKWPIDWTALASDFRTLKTMGFIIDEYDKGKHSFSYMGEGSFGAVFYGRYGKEIEQQKDRSSGQRLRNVKVDQLFAIKCTHIHPNDPLADTYRLVMEREKQIMKRLNHENVLTYRMIVNIGPSVEYTMPDGQVVLSYDRSYMLMDFAEYGSLDRYAEHCLLTGYSVSKIFWDLLAGLKYLHINHVIHGDISARNVLIFFEWHQRPTPVTESIDTQSEPAVTAKWADFGMAKQYPMNVTDPNEQWRMGSDMKKDVEDMCDMFDLMAYMIMANPLLRYECPILAELTAYLRNIPSQELPVGLNMRPYLHTDLSMLFIEHMNSPEMEYYSSRHFVDYILTYPQ
ncbi:uncharacterized protein LOC128964993 [Oppia nitens]|uniref:uncharacterized protein LOC128964993 n=1 Tax=Oppia nitens TaxID=1686743 RepID=UPI0023DB7D5E|nr:uncharacterized protein LOC128964993 [Oppia nitens]